MVEEVKRGKQPMKVRPKVGNMKATIVSMEYKNNKSDDFEKLKPLSESNTDADKVIRLFENTLEWSKNDVLHY